MDDLRPLSFALSLSRDKTVCIERERKWLFRIFALRNTPEEDCEALPGMLDMMVSNNCSDSYITLRLSAIMKPCLTYDQKRLMYRSIVGTALFTCLAFRCRSVAEERLGIRVFYILDCL